MVASLSCETTPEKESRAVSSLKGMGRECRKKLSDRRDADAHDIQDERRSPSSSVSRYVIRSSSISLEEVAKPETAWSSTLRGTMHAKSRRAAQLGRFTKQCGTLLAGRSGIAGNTPSRSAPAIGEAWGCALFLPDLGEQPSLHKTEISGNGDRFVGVADNGVVASI